MAAFSEVFLSEDNFETVLVSFCCYDCDANASETVKKIRILFQMFPVFFNLPMAKAKHIINNRKKLLTRTPLT